MLRHKRRKKERKVYGLVVLLRSVLYEDTSAAVVCCDPQPYTILLSTGCQLLTLDFQLQCIKLSFLLRYVIIDTTVSESILCMLTARLYGLMVSLVIDMRFLTNGWGPQDQTRQNEGP